MEVNVNSKNNYTLVSVKHKKLNETIKSVFLLILATFAMVFSSCDGVLFETKEEVEVQIYDTEKEEEITKDTTIAPNYGCLIFTAPESSPIEMPLSFVLSIDINGTTYTETLSQGQTVVINNIPAGKIYPVKCSAMTQDGNLFAAGSADAKMTAGKINPLDLVMTRMDGGSDPLPTTVTVTFNSNGGSSVAPQTFTRGGKATQPEDPTKENTTFLGWFEDLTNENAFDFNTEINSDKTLYAKWQGYPVISFDTHDGSSVASQSVPSGGRASRPEDPTKEGYTFLDWYISTTSTVPFNFDTQITEDITLHAKWEAYPVVTFDSNGGSFSGNISTITQTVAKGGKAIQPSNPTRENYTFLGWYESKTGGAEFNFNTAINANKTLYARWEPYPVVTFDANGGSFTGNTSTITQSVAKGGYATRPTNPTQENYTFLGWYESKTGGTAFNFNTAINADKTLYARWEAYPVVTFDANGGSFTGNNTTITQTVAKGGYATRPSNPTRENYTFLGWYENQTGGTEFNFNTAINADKTLYARWEPYPVVTFDANGGSFSGNTSTITQSVAKGGKATRPETDPVKEGFTFLDWYEEATCVTPFDFDTAINANKTLYAGWENAGTFHGTTYHVLEEADGTAGPDWTYVEFGDWPQTIKADDVTVDESISTEVGMFTYYMGSDGAWYAKIKENAYSTSYEYSNGTTVKESYANSYKYFKVEPIKWRVLTANYSGKKLLLAENILVNGAFYDLELNRSGPIYPSNYKESRVRAYLNGISYNKKGTSNSDFLGKGFLQTAFSEEIRSLIEDTLVNNSYFCDSTTDKLFLLSLDEVLKTNYGFATNNQGGLGNSRIRQTTDFAKASGAEQNTTTGYGGKWWTRTPDWEDYEDEDNELREYVESVDYDGKANQCSGVSFTTYGVVPALCIDN